MEEKTEQAVEKEYQDEFNRLAEGGEPTKPGEEPKVKKEETEPDPEKDTAKSGAGEPKTEKSEQEAKDGAHQVGAQAPEGLAKAFKDTKAYATKLSMELAELKKQVEISKAGGVNREKEEAARESVGEARKTLDEKIKKAAEDYPELKEVLDLLAKTAVDLSGKVQNFEKATEKESKQVAARAQFEAEVAPEIAKAHSDWREVVFSKEYMAWVETQSPATQFAATRSLNPTDIAETITKFKKFQGSDDAEKAKRQEQEREDGVRNNLSSLRGGGSVSQKKAASAKDLDPNDREAAFAFLAAQDDKKK